LQRTRERTIRALRLACSGLLPALTAFVIAAWTAPETIASGELTASAVPAIGARAAPAPVLSTPADDGVQVRHLIARGDSFASVLAARGLAAAEIHAWEQAAAATYDLAAVLSRHALVLTFARDGGQLTACDYEIDKYALLSLRLVHGQIQARMKAMPRLAAVRGVAARVEASLATSATAAGVPAPMVAELGDIFGWELDPQSDVRPGDEFRVLYAELRDDAAGTVRPGDILAAEIKTGGRTYTAIRFENEQGESEYYDPDGHALGRRFLKYPVAFTTISSTFSGSRFHPVLKRCRPHLGVDFAAPSGTPVRAVATGVVRFAKYNGEYGNQVAIEHDAVYASSYSHLRRIARGIRLGVTVEKGQVIGYVGRSGMATGPHLHFMLFKDGTYVNPLAASLPADEELTGPYRTRFAALRGELLERLADLGRTVDLPKLSLAPSSVLDMIRPSAASSIN
jgi:murein DD-endopeptidase MepM/ murein hydrolase activator NlpD